MKYSASAGIAEDEPIETAEFSSITGFITAAAIKNIKKGDLPQQDAMMVGYATNPEAAKNPKVFLSNSIEQTVIDHEECFCGATIAAVVITPDQKILPNGLSKNDYKITTATLGDSQVSGVIRFMNAAREIKYRQIVLAPSHDLDKKEVAKYVQDNGGVILEDQNGTLRINGLNMGGSIGDFKAGRVIHHGKFTDCLMRKPVTKTYNVSDFCKAEETLLDAYIVTSSDGVLQTPSFVAKAKSAFDKARANDPEKFTNFASFLAQRARDAGSKDDISAIVTTLVEDGMSLKLTNPLLAVVTDGHGRGSFDLSDKKLWDGSLVANSVVAATCRDAVIEQVLGVEIIQQSDFLKHFMQQEKIAKEVATLEERRMAEYRNLASQMLNVAGDKVKEKSKKAREKIINEGVSNLTKLMLEGEPLPECSAYAAILFTLLNMGQDRSIMPSVGSHLFQQYYDKIIEEISSANGFEVASELVKRVVKIIDDNSLNHLKQPAQIELETLRIIQDVELASAAAAIPPAAASSATEASPLQNSSQTLTPHS